MSRRQNWRTILRKGFVLPKIDRDTSFPYLVSLVRKAVQDHLLQSKSIRSYLAYLPKGPGTYCPNSKVSVLQEYISSQNSEIDRSDPVVFAAFMLKIIVPTVDFGHQQVLSAVKMIDDINPAEKTILRTSAIIAQSVNRLWLKWFAAVVLPFQKMTLLERQNLESRAVGYLPKPDYTVFDYDSDTESFSNRKTWAEAFPREIDIICRRLKIFKWSKINSKQGSVFPAYFKALGRAYGCKKINQLKKYWEKVDQLWFKINKESRILPVHNMMYGYEHPFCVSPEFRLEIRVSNENIIFGDIRMAVESCVKSLIDTECLKINNSILALQKIEVGMFECAIQSGAAINSPNGGEMISNSKKEGGKILLAHSMLQSTGIYFAREIRRNCTFRTKKNLQDCFHQNAILYYYLGHEFGHLICGAQDIKLEEAKASAISILANEYMEDTPEKRLSLVAVALGDVLSILNKSALNELTTDDYTRECLMLANTLFRSGVIKLTKRGIRVNLEQARSRAWFEQLEEFVYELLLAYRDNDKVNLERLTKRYCRKIGPVAELIDWINRE
ncbi:MAG: hypothetical protein COU29_02150 [Candidatus Magasanikbacteria bacterium CG10_big_fil_rev_8_21_14_0_10_36_32]|uniref:Uncharacterized protein n=1 Tax=Candidatus Magasanikbacteria bacterium CG10_big_fil_rev_8_21_14_0_10_36_32 TaxID=1974646 RepID=A0A2M6W703_9BACT|nr:MAG: hypothetical protein COU29_02150 [Candidatus Magasanikbacteria bacterium CG10_big_fil_rev_8_21_14_0_10_36_32]